MPRFVVDLHNHTPLIASDYRGDPATTPRQIVERALARGIDVWGIADHWTVEYAPELVAAAETVAAETGRRLLVLPGAELRVRYEGEETHLVCLFPPDGTASERFARLLGKLGLSAPVAPQHELPFFAIEHSPLEVAELAAEAGALCHIGHADRTFGEYRFIESELVHRLADSPHVSAIELVDHTNRRHLRDGLELAHICSSDSHSLEEMGRRTATLEMPEISFEGLRAALLAARSSG